MVEDAACAGAAAGGFYRLRIAYPRFTVINIDY